MLQPEHVLYVLNTVYIYFRLLALNSHMATCCQKLKDIVLLDILRLLVVTVTEFYSVSKENSSVHLMVQACI
jgi:hypothetical protein